MSGDDDNNVVALPYGTGDNRNSGFSGSDTSRARAREADLSGLTGVRQRETMRHLANREARGITWKELAELTGWHHGTCSGALSNLHSVDRIARLAETRLKCKVYVLPRYVNDRPVEGAGRQSSAALAEDFYMFIQGLDPRFLTQAQQDRRVELLRRRPRQRR